MPDRHPQGPQGGQDRTDDGTRRSGNQRKSSEELERDIAHTRAEMDETVGEIQERLRPERLRRQAKHTVRETARDTARGASSTMIDTIKENPIPSLIAGLSVGWLVARGSHHTPRQQQSSHDGQARPYAAPPYYREEYDPATYETEAYDTETYDTGQEDRSMRDRAGETAQHTQEKAKHMGRQARHKAEHLGERAQHQARRAPDRMSRMAHENPMALGTATLALGAFVGLMLPGTRKEDEMMGPARDRTMQKARAKAGDTMQRAERVAERTAEEAKKSAQEVKQTAKDEAKKQDLPGAK